MDWDRVEGNWKQAKGKIKEQWGKLTDDDLDVIAGRQDQLEGKIQERYGYAKDQVRSDVDKWLQQQRWEKAPLKGRGRKRPRSDGKSFAWLAGASETDLLLPSPVGSLAKERALERPAGSTIKRSCPTPVRSGARAPSPSFPTRPE